MKAKAAATVFCAGLLLAGCGTTPAPPAGEEIPAEVPSNLEERFVHQVVFSLGDSFEQRNTTTFMKHVSEGFYLGRARLEENLRETFAAAGEEALSVEIVEVSVEELKVTALLRWKRSPAGGAAGGASLEGTTELIFQKGQTLSLVQFKRDALFGITGF